MKYLNYLVFLNKYLLRLIFDFFVSYYIYFLSRKEKIFDPIFYKKTYKINLNNSFILFLHYYFKGYLQLKSPSKNFSTIYYYSLISDAYKFKVNPLSDYFFRIKKSFPTFLKNFEKNFDDNGFLVPQKQEKPIEFKNYSKPVVKIYALYLPQYHNDKLNNKFWGEGFTEWTNVKKNKPKFNGHYAEFIPLQGYYSLENEYEIEKQCKLAKAHGITGFGIFIYDFGNNTYPLFKIIPNLVKIISKYQLEFSFIWANEPWTRTWDGLNKNILIDQPTFVESDQIQNLVDRLYEYIKLDNYQKINGKKIFTIYRPDYFKNLDDILNLLKINFNKENINIEIVAANTFSLYQNKEVLKKFDIVLEYPPHPQFEESGNSFFKKYGSHLTFCYERSYLSFNKFLNLKNKLFNQRFISNIFSSWDNSPRKENNANIFINSNEKTFKKFLINSIDHEINEDFKDKVIFINAWNEWGEGSNLEPDKEFGYWKLNSISEVLNNYQSLTLPIKKNFKTQNKKIIISHIYFQKDFENLIKYVKLHPEIDFFTTYTVSKINFDYIFKLENYNNLVCLPVTNRGRDMLCIIKSLPYLNNQNYKIKAKIHFKRKQSKGGKEIKYSQTIKYIEDILKLMSSIDVEKEKNNKIFCHKEYILNNYFYYGSNKDEFHKLIAEFDMPLKKSIFKPFLSGGNYLIIDQNNFFENFISFLDEKKFIYDDEYYSDGQYEHSIERMIGPYFLSNDFKLIKI